MDGTSGFEDTLTQTLRRVDLHLMRRPIEFPHDIAENIRLAHEQVDLMMERLRDEETDVATLREHVTQVERLKRRVEAVQLRLTAKASQVRAHESDGRLDSGAWLAGATDSDRRHAAGQAALAEALGDQQQAAGDGTMAGVAEGGEGGGGEHDSGAAGGTGEAGTGDAGTGDADTGDAGITDADGTGGEDRPRDSVGADDRQADGHPRLTATGAALDAGTISAAHAQVIMRALDDLPDGVTDEQRRACEQELLLLCTNRSPGQLRRAARRVLEAIEPEAEVVDQHEDDLVADEEELARDKAAFWVKDNQDGTVTGHFTVPWVSGMMLKKVIDAMTAPRRQSAEDPGKDRAGAGHHDGTDRRASAGKGSTSKDRYLDWQHRRGLAFADLLTRIPTDHLHTKVSATMLITTRLSDLLGDLETAGAKVASTDVHDVLSAGAARRLACGAGLLPTVLDGDSVPLDLGRQRRLFTDNQRMALAERYNECAAQGCDRPFAWTETHHLKPWEAGGRTDLDNAVPLCGTHHHMIDSSRWSYVVTRLARQTVSLTFHRRT